MTECCRISDCRESVCNIDEFMPVVYDGRSFSVAGISAGQLYESVLRQLQGRGEGQADANPLWLKTPQLCHHLIDTFYTNATR